MTSNADAYAVYNPLRDTGGRFRLHGIPLGHTSSSYLQLNGWMGFPLQLFVV